ncbi:hypothetical protein [Nocardiopsis potens]|uniref:hypothetical protein n=1 Tax=Nocardiopsis potens TaxID=1246458 RepID=UPI0003482224|nr:hypothetical protein [Nocardiopsis potens]
MAMPGAVRLTGAALFAAVALAGCGAESFEGEWEALADDPAIEALTITGNTVETQGEIACPGTLEPSGDGTTAAIELDCDDPDPQRQSGTAELENGTLVISWDGAEWGGYIDTFS